MFSNKIKNRKIIYGISVFTFFSLARFGVYLFLLLPYLTSFISLADFGAFAFMLAFLMLGEYISNVGTEWRAFSSKNVVDELLNNYLLNVTMIALFRCIILIINLLVIYTFFDVNFFESASSTFELLIYSSFIINSFWACARPLEIQKGNLSFVSLIYLLSYLIAAGTTLILHQIVMMHHLHVLMAIFILEYGLTGVFAIIYYRKLLQSKLTIEDVKSRFLTDIRLAALNSFPTIVSFLEKMLVANFMSKTGLAIYNHGLAYRNALLQLMKGIASSLPSQMRDPSTFKRSYRIQIATIYSLLIVSFFSYKVGLILINYSSSGLFNDAAILLPYFLCAVSISIASLQYDHKLKFNDMKNSIALVNLLVSIFLVISLYLLIKDYTYLGVGVAYYLSQCVRYVLLRLVIWKMEMHCIHDNFILCGSVVTVAWHAFNKLPDL